MADCVISGVMTGGVTNGQDMVAAYIRAKWPGPTAETVLAVADVSDRGDEYRVSNASPGVEFNDKS